MILPADVRIGAEGSRFGLPFTRRGIVPESCATWFLPRIVGIATAVDWAVTGRIFDAHEARAAGLVRELCPPDEVLPRAVPPRLQAELLGQVIQLIPWQFGKLPQRRHRRRRRRDDRRRDGARHRRGRRSGRGGWQ